MKQTDKDALAAWHETHTISTVDLARNSPDYADIIDRVFLAGRKSRDAEIETLMADKQALFYSIHEIFFYEGGANNALEDSYIMERLEGLIDRFKEPFDLEDAAASFLGRPVLLQTSHGCAEDRIKRCKSGAIAGDGSCMYCEADAGVACRDTTLKGQSQ